MVADANAVALRCWIEDRRVWMELDDGRIASFPSQKYPRLADAAESLLTQVKLRVQGRALRWEDLDEDIWVEDAISGRFPKTTPA